MSKLYIITLNILPFLINANGYLTHLKEIIKEDIRNIKIKYGFTKKNLILGGIKNLSWKLIKPFFVSLSQANITNIDIVLFCKKISIEVESKLKSLNVKILDIPEEYNKLSVPDVRYVLYEKYLRDKWQNYNMILTVDIRDVFFQKDIFKYYENYKSFLGLAIEDGDLTEKANKRWYVRIYGNDTYNQIKNERIICCGTLWGTSDKFYELSYDMAKELNSKYPLNIGVHDQPVLNYLVYYLKKYKDYIIKSDNNGPVITIGSSKREYLKFDSDKFLLNYKGEIPALIHQYDRFSDISKKIRDKYNNDNNLTISSNEFYDNNNFFIYFFVLLAILFFCIILVIITFRYFFNKFRKIKASISQKQLNKFKAVKIEKSKKKRKGKFTRGKWNIVLNYTDI